MTDKRRLAVSYGSFSCVIEGFDEPFNLMRDIISFYYQVSQEEPEFAQFHEIVDMQELKALLESDLGQEIALEEIAGGVFVRKIETPTELAGTAETEEAGDSDDAMQVGAAEAEAEAEDDRDHEGATPVYAAFGQYEADDDAQDAQADIADGASAEPMPDASSESHENDGVDVHGQESGAEDDSHDAWTEATDTATEAALAAESGDHDTGQEAAEDAPGAENQYAEEPEVGAHKDWDDVEQSDDVLHAAPDHADWDEDHDANEAADRAVASADDDAAPEDASGDEPEPQANAPIRLYDALHSGTAASQDAAASDDDAEDAGGNADDSEDHEDAAHRPAPIRLSDALRETPADSDDDPVAGDAAAEEAEAPAKERLTLGAALRLGPSDEVSARTRASDDDGADEDEDEPAGAFIDRVAEKEETRDLLTTPTPHRRNVEPEDETPVDVSIAQIRSELGAEEDDEKPKKTGGLRMGNLLRRRSSPQDDENAATDSDAEDAQGADEPETLTGAEKPRSLGSGRLRVIRSESRDRDADSLDPVRRSSEPETPPPQAEAPEPQHEAAAPEPERETEPEHAELRPGMAEAHTPEDRNEPTEPVREEPASARDRRDRTRGNDPLRNRLHASFDSHRAPSSARDTIDLSSGEMQDPYSPRGFAQRVGASSAAELIAAAAAFCILVDGKSSVTRTDIMETVQMIMGDKPLSAEAKVKAFGKLVRGGELTRLDGGEFALSPEELDSYQERFEEARKSNAAGA